MRHKLNWYSERHQLISMSFQFIFFKLFWESAASFRNWVSHFHSRIQSNGKLDASLNSSYFCTYIFILFEKFDLLTLTERRRRRRRKINFNAFGLTFFIFIDTKLLVCIRHMACLISFNRKRWISYFFVSIASN